MIFLCVSVVLLFLIILLCGLILFVLLIYILRFDMLFNLNILILSVFNFLVEVLEFEIVLIMVFFIVLSVLIK